MQSITEKQVFGCLEDASHIERQVDVGDRMVTFGIDPAGREFILIQSAYDGSGIIGLM